eukprot:Tamp_07461.p1 GENE.Tamp_07461~~Tamp_07461.p1  ORF type:complete len:420 (-),score=102.23 Tamp_07461:1237-2406(-)
MGQRGKDMEAAWEQNWKGLQFFITFTAVTTIFSKFLPKEPKEIVDTRRTEKEKKAKEKEAKKKTHVAKAAEGKEEAEGEQGGGEGDASAGGETKERSVSMTPYIIIFGVLIRMHMDKIMIMLGLSAGNGARMVYSCAKDQPLWGKTEYFLPGKSLPDLQAALSANKLSAPAFSYGPASASGFRVSFDLHGLGAFESDPRLQDVQVIFSRARLSEATAWTLSVLEAASSEGAADQKTLPLRQMHLRMRRFNDTVKYVAHHLDVLWLQVPEDGVGGHLQIFQRGRGDPAKDALVLAAPDAVLEPEENTNVQIRGDAYVQMDGFRSLGAGRIKVVMLEQYILPPEKLEDNSKHFFVHEHTVSEEDEARKQTQGKRMQAGAGEEEKEADKAQR